MQGSYSLFRPIRLVGLLGLFLTNAPAAEPPRPNILFILADDLGWSDLACYGNKWFETPHLDRLASEGVRFTQAYSPAPICSASRAAIHTGKTPARLHFEFVTKPESGHQQMVTALRAPPYTLDLALEETTIAETLRNVGYRTAFFGKWHLNRHHGGYLGWSPTHGPAAQGFEVTTEEFGNHPYAYWDDPGERNFLPVAQGEFPEDALTRHAIDFITGPHERPFFLTISHFYVHDPIHTRMEWLRDRCLERIPGDHPRREILADYGAMVTTLDHHVGELIAALGKAGLADNTLGVFTSDNGGHPNYAGNAPLRGSKWNLYEGGIRVPFLARWPGHIPAASESPAPVSGLDLFPTFAALAGATLPPDLDGETLLPLLSDPAHGPEARDLLWHFPYYHPERRFDKALANIGIDDGLTSQTRPHSALRSGPWKLLRFFEDGREELYHLPTDPNESRDRSQGEAALVKTLSTKLESKLSEAKARLPLPHPAFPRADAKPLRPNSVFLLADDDRNRAPFDTEPVFDKAHLEILTRSQDTLEDLRSAEPRLW